MTREIYKVTAEIIDANGTYNSITNYPKIFDSKNYNNDTKKTYQRAIGDWHEVMGAFGKRDDRQLQIAQVIFLNTGAIIQNEYVGQVSEIENIENEEVE